MSKNLTFVNDPWAYGPDEQGVWRDEEQVAKLERHKVLNYWRFSSDADTFTAEDLLEIVAKLNELNNK